MPLTVAWQRSVTFYSFIFILFLLRLRSFTGLGQGSPRSAGGICCRSAVCSRETTESWRKELRSWELSENCCWDGFWGPSGLSFVSLSAFWQSISHRVPLLVATFCQPPAECAAHFTRRWVARTLLAGSTLLCCWGRGNGAPHEI